MFKAISSILSLALATQVFAAEYPKLITPELYVAKGAMIAKMYASANETGLNPSFKIKDYTVSDYKMSVSEYISDDHKRDVYSSACMPKLTKCTKENANFIFSDTKPDSIENEEQGITVKCYLKGLSDRDSKISESAIFYNCGEVPDLTVEKYIAYNKALANGKPELYNEIISGATEEELAAFMFLMKNAPVYKEVTDPLSVLATTTKQEVFVENIMAYENERIRRYAEKINMHTNQPQPMGESALKGKLNYLGQTLGVH